MSAAIAIQRVAKPSAARAIRRSLKLPSQEPGARATAAGFKRSTTGLEIFPRCVYPGSDCSPGPQTSHESPPGATPRSVHSPRPRSSEKGFPTRPCWLHPWVHWPGWLLPLEATPAPAAVGS